MQNKLALRFFVAAALLATALFTASCKTESAVELTPVEGFIGTAVADHMHGYVVMEHLSTWWVTSNYYGEGSMAEQIQSMLKNANAEWEGSGANALINMRISSSTAEQQGSKWNTATVIIYGDLVKLGKKR